MVESHKLDEWGKRISKDFVSDNVSLNDGLKKVASDNGLNKQQIQRVAESANTETYLDLLKTAKDNYVDFDLADFKSVYKDIETPTSSSPFQIDDYDKDYQDVAREFSQATTEKTASADDYLVATEDETVKTAHAAALEARDTIPFLENALSEAELDFERNYISLEKLAKQAVLGDVPYKDVTYIIKKAAPGVSAPIEELLTKTMVEYAPHYDLEKESSVQGVANPQSEIYKSAAAIEANAVQAGKVEQALLKVAAEYQDLIKCYNLPLVKTAGSFRVVYDPKAAPIIRSTVKNMWKFVKEHPKTSIAVGAFGVGKTQGKKIGKRKQGEILERARVYKERKPTVLAYKGNRRRK